jgi:hypothetical protein
LGLFFVVQFFFFYCFFSLGEQPWEMSGPEAVATLMDVMLYEEVCFLFFLYLFILFLFFLFYQQARLKECAIALLFRTLRPQHELLRTLENVQLILEPEMIKIYKSCTQKVDVIRDLIKDNDVSESDCATITPFIDEFTRLCCIDNGMFLFWFVLFCLVVQ